ncbi:hypothetical protein JCM11491_001822 [Sporobolomyces phaffii]
MVLFSLTPALEAKLEHIRPLLPTELVHLVRFYAHDDDASSSTLPASDGPRPRDRDRDRTIDHHVLVKVSRWAHDHADAINDDDDNDDAQLNESRGRGRGHPVVKRDDYRLSNLVRLTTVHAPALVPRQKSPELVAILASIQLANDRAAYAALTSLSTPQYRSVLPLTDPHEPASTLSSTTTATVSDEWGDVKKEVSAIVNVVCSVAAVFTSVWYVGFGYSPPIVRPPSSSLFFHVERDGLTTLQLEHHPPPLKRLGLSLLGAVAIAAIEGWLYYRVFTRVRRNGGGSSPTTTTAMGSGGGRPRGKVLKFE